MWNTKRHEFNQKAILSYWGTHRRLAGVSAFIVIRNAARMSAVSRQYVIEVLKAKYHHM